MTLLVKKNLSINSNLVYHIIVIFNDGEL